MAKKPPSRILDDKLKDRLYAKLPKPDRTGYAKDERGRDDNAFLVSTSIGEPRTGVYRCQCTGVEDDPTLEGRKRMTFRALESLGDAGPGCVRWDGLWPEWDIEAFVVSGEGKSGRFVWRLCEAVKIPTRERAEVELDLDQFIGLFVMFYLEPESGGAYIMDIASPDNLEAIGRWCDGGVMDGRHER